MSIYKLSTKVVNLDMKNRKMRDIGIKRIKTLMLVAENIAREIMRH